jgi:hypothetical protein
MGAADPGLLPTAVYIFSYPLRRRSVICFGRVFPAYVATMENVIDGMLNVDANADSSLVTNL